MRVFDHMNEVGKPCPVCVTKEDKPVVLVGIDGTEDGGNIEAMQVHLDCINLRSSNRGDTTIMYQMFTNRAPVEFQQTSAKGE